MREKNPKTFFKIENFVDDYREANGFSPTVREIAAGIGVSKTTVVRYLEAMRSQGKLSYSGHRNIITEKAKKTKDGVIWATRLDSMANCSEPNYTEESIKDYIPLPVALFGQGNFFILTANDDSMIDAGIDEGDLLLIRKQDTANEGQIVVALIGDESTLKRYYPEPEKCRIRLHSDNKSMDDIYVDNCVVQGVLVGAIKMFDKEQKEN